MFLRPYDEKDGRMVWLDEDEVELFLSRADDTTTQIAFALGVRCGLRSHEIVSVTPADIVATSAGPRVRIEEGKGDTYRETPAPIELYHSAKSAVDFGGIDRHQALVPKSTRTIRRWVSTTGDELAEMTGDTGWSYLGSHDLRRTWATQLAGSGIDPLLVCDWGGWDDIETFLEHYRGVYSPQVQRRELDKVDWLDGDPVDGDRDPDSWLFGHNTGSREASSPVKPQG